MRLGRIHVKNFRCIKDQAMTLRELTAFVGRNGTGKSSMLRALKMFYDPGAQYTEDDFYNRNTADPITITVTFTNLTGEEVELFGRYVEYEDPDEDEGENPILTVEKELTWPRSRTSQRYYGSLMRCPEFQEIRDLDRVTDQREIYAEFVESGDFEGLRDLPGNCSGNDLQNALEEWEAENPDRLARCRDQGQFFGFREVGSARLERFTRFVFVPAVRDASEEAEEGSGSVMAELMDVLVRSTLEARQDLQELRDRVHEEYQQLINPEGGLPELVGLQDSLKSKLQTLVPGAGIYLNWDTTQDVKLPSPQAKVKLEEDAFQAPVDRVGHGLQRAFIFVVLQELAHVRANEAADEDDQDDGEHDEAAPATQPSLIIAVEEVELYQHPARQRHMAKILLSLSREPPPGLASMQVIYTTHSPLFVGLERFHQIRLFRKTIRDRGQPKVTDIAESSLSHVVQRKEEIEQVTKGTFSPEGERARLRTLMTPWTNEGFFADKVVLVEGAEDRAAIRGTAIHLEENLEGQNIAVIPVNGKTNLIKGLLVFEAFEIDVYTIWDSDANEGEEGSPKTNRQLLRALGHDEEDDFPEHCTPAFTCFHENLTREIKQTVGRETYRDVLDEQKKEFGFMKDKQARKNPEVVRALLKKATEEGTPINKLEGAVQHITGGPG